MSYLDELDEAVDANAAALTDRERNAIMSLHRLARRWPDSLALVSMGGALYVIRADDERFRHPDGTERQKAVIQHIPGVPNDGGDW